MVVMTRKEGGCSQEEINLDVFRKKGIWMYLGKKEGWCSKEERKVGVVREKGR